MSQKPLWESREMKSSNLQLSKRRRTYIRMLGEIQHVLLEALEEESRDRGLTRAEMARSIGKNKSFVTRKLSGDSNMTLQSLADLAFSLDRPVKVNLPSRHAQISSNRTVANPATSETPAAISVKPFATTGDMITATAA